MPTALVTGATGLVGSHIVERLGPEWNVRALVRDPVSAKEIIPRAELRLGDILDTASILQAAKGADVIFHTAAVITEKGDWDSYRRTNADGTRNVVNAAAGAGARLLHLSSVAVYGSARFRSDGQLTDEQASFGDIPDGNVYARSKREAELIALDAHRAGEVWATAIRPCVVYGRRDRQFVPRAARLFSTGFAPAFHGGTSVLAIIHAANVAEGAIRAAATDAAGGQAYNITNEDPVTVAEFAQLAAEGLERRVRLLPVSARLADAGFRLASAARRVIRGKGLPMMSGGPTAFLSRDNPFSSERARRELGWSPVVTPRAAVPDAFRWWREQRRR